ncbi:MAG: hypothetical protein KC502_11120 [Myxococcales bacterium]|nr:hypothetical protein [Myxococcales bacterium]
MRTRLIAALMLLTLLPGCSFMFMRPPPPEQVWPRVQYPRCSTTRAWPIIDSIFVLSTASQMLILSNIDDNNGFSRSTEDSILQMTTSGLMLLAWGASAWVGFDRAGRCEALHGYLMRRPGSPGARPTRWDLQPTTPAAATRPAPATPGTSHPPPAGYRPPGK